MFGYIYYKIDVDKMHMIEVSREVLDKSHSRVHWPRDVCHSQYARDQYLLLQRKNFLHLPFLVYYAHREEKTQLTVCVRCGLNRNTLERKRE
jgi:hypothetical protein